jgi:hypothetical protein
MKSACLAGTDGSTDGFAAVVEVAMLKCFRLEWECEEGWDGKRSGERWEDEAKVVVKKLA